MCSCATAVVRYLMFFANLVFSLVGLAILGIGVALQLRVTQITSLVDSYFNVAPALAITFGAIVFVIAFFGCCGAIRESNCMLVFYAILLIILMLVKIVFAALLLTNKASVDTATVDWINNAFAHYSDDSVAHQAIDELQTVFQCCGTTGPSSYPITVPMSCCESGVTTCSVANAYSTGCLNMVTDFLNTYVNALAALLLIVSGVELVAIILGLCLANDARNKERRYY